MVRLTDRPDMTLDVYRGRKTTQQHNNNNNDSTSTYLDGVLNIYNPFFEGMVGRIYALELQLNEANASDIEAPFFGLFHPNFMISTKTLIFT